MENRNVPGGYLVLRSSIVDVAALAGVSKSTVSRVLSGQGPVGAETVQRVREACKTLKYRPNTSARDLRIPGDGRMGILVPRRISNSFMYQLNAEKLEGAVSRAGELDRDLMVFVYDPEAPKDLHNLVLEKGLSGVLLLDNIGVDALAHLNQFGIPYVQVNWYINGYANQLYVKTDLAEAVRMGFDHLYRRGYRDIGLIHWEDHLRQDEVASRAFQDCLAAKGLPQDPGRLAPLLTDAVAPLLKQRRRAYLCFSYFISQHIYTFCREEGLRIPEDLALVSYEFFEFYDFLQPRLTGLRQQGHLIGREAVDMLAECMAGRKVQNRLIPPELVVRASC